jgi:hypothetical protein
LWWLLFDIFQRPHSNCLLVTVRFLSRHALEWAFSRALKQTSF